MHRGLFLAGLLCAALAPSAQAAVATLPVDAPGLLPGAGDTIDAGLHDALTHSGYDVLPRDRVARFIKDAVDAGLSCSLADDDCALRAAVAAGADAVCVPRAVRVDDRLVLVLRLLHLDQSPPQAAAGRLDTATQAQDLQALAQRLRDPAASPPTPLPVMVTVEPPDAVLTVDGRLRDSQETAAGHIWLVPGTHLVRVSAPGFESTQVVVDVPADRLLEPRTITLERGFPALAAIGIGVASVGGVVLAVGGVGAGVAEAILGGPLAPETRSATETTGRILLGAAVVGAVTIVGGAAVAVVGFGE